MNPIVFGPSIRSKSKVMKLKVIIHDAADELQKIVLLLRRKIVKEQTVLFICIITFTACMLGCPRDMTLNVIGTPEPSTHHIYTIDELDMTSLRNVIYAEAYTNSDGAIYIMPDAHTDDRQFQNTFSEVHTLSVSDWSVVYVSGLTDDIYNAPPANDKIYHIAIGDSSWGPGIYIYQRPNALDTAFIKTYRPIVELQGTQAALNVLLRMYVDQNKLPDYYFYNNLAGQPNVVGDTQIITDDYLEIYLFTTRLPEVVHPNPSEGSQWLMDRINGRRTKAYDDAKAVGDFTTLPDTSDEIFKEVILGFGFEKKGFAMKLITIWEETFFARHQANVIDDTAVERYNNFRSVYHEKLEAARGEPYFEYIRVYDNIIAEYLQIALELELVSLELVSSEERIIERFRESMEQGKVDIIYPEGF